MDRLLDNPINGQAILLVDQKMFKDYITLLEYFHKTESEKRENAINGRYISLNTFGSEVGVSQSTVQSWCKTFLKPAIIKSGNVVRLRNPMAFELFEKHCKRNDVDYIEELLETQNKGKRRKRYTLA